MAARAIRRAEFRIVGRTYQDAVGWHQSSAKRFLLFFNGTDEPTLPIKFIGTHGAQKSIPPVKSKEDVEEVSEYIAENGARQTDAPRRTV
jgi:hypothetical protein